MRMELIENPLRSARQKRRSLRDLRRTLRRVRRIRKLQEYRDGLRDRVGVWDS